MDISAKFLIPPKEIECVYLIFCSSLHLFSVLIFCNSLQKITYPRRKGRKKQKKIQKFCPSRIVKIHFLILLRRTEKIVLLLVRKTTTVVDTDSKHRERVSIYKGCVCTCRKRTFSALSEGGVQAEIGGGGQCGGAQVLGLRCERQP